MIAFVQNIGAQEIVLLLIFGAFFAYVCMPWIARKLGRWSGRQKADFEKEVGKGE